VPLLDRVLVQRVKADTKTASGLLLPESSVKELNEAKVLAVGPGNLDKDGKRTPMGVTAGDRVLIPQVRRPSCPPAARNRPANVAHSTAARPSRSARTSSTSSGTASEHCSRPALRALRSAWLLTGSRRILAKINE